MARTIRNDDTARQRAAAVRTTAGPDIDEVADLSDGFELKVPVYDRLSLRDEKLEEVPRLSFVLTTPDSSRQSVGGSRQA